MTCPLCRERKARRHCPALGSEICPACCGVKRQVEIRCPSDCAYLANAKAHPPAVIARQHQRDAAFLMPLVTHLHGFEGMLLLTLHATIRRHRLGAIPPLTDDDVANAAGALASTFETATRGIIYEHQASSLPSQRLLVDLRTAIGEAARGTAQTSRVERLSIPPLRAIEKGARQAGARLSPGATSYLDLLERMAQFERAGATTDSLENRGAAREPGEGPLSRPGPTEPRIILP